MPIDDTERISLEAARLEAQKQWNANPCGALPTDVFDKAYFDRVEADRYRQQYWQKDWFDYASYKGKKALNVLRPLEGRLGWYVCTRATAQK